MFSQEETIQWKESNTTNLRRLAKFASPDHWLKSVDDDEDSSPEAPQQEQDSSENAPNSTNNVPTPVIRNTAAVGVAWLPDTAVDWVASRKRQRREFSLQQRRQQRVVVTATPATTCAATRAAETDTPLPLDGAADFDELLRQVQTPSPDAANEKPRPAAVNNPYSQPAHDTGSSSQTNPAATGVHDGDNDDEYGNLELSLEDFEQMDSMVQQALTQSQATVDKALESDDKKQNKSQVGVIDNVLEKEGGLVAEKANDEEDPFGEFPEVDFDALDKCIAQYVSTSTQESPKAAPTRQSDPLPQSSAVVGVPPVHAAVRNPRHPRTHSDLSYLSYSRYKVVDVRLDDVTTFTKTLMLAAWTSEMLKEDPRSIHKSDANGNLRQKAPKQWPVDGVVHLRGEWYHTPVAPGNVIHICSLLGQFRTDSTALPLVLHTTPPPGSDADDLVLIVHPDLLLTPTTISETVSCTRRAILKNRLGSTGLTSKAPLLGTMRHELFEETMRQQDYSMQSARTHIQSIVRRNAHGLLSCNVSSAQAESELQKFVPQLQRFMAEFTNLGGQHAGAVLENHAAQPSVRFLAKQVDSIEEPAISPELGLKGNVDMIVNVAMSDIGSPSSATNMSLLGVELKTGHNQNTQHAHMAQLALYILMMQTRYGQKMSRSNEVLGAAPSGMLLYMNNEALRAVHIAPLMSELKSLIGQRNLVAIEQVRVSRPRGIILSYDNEEEYGNAGLNVRIEETAPAAAALPEILPSNHLCTRCYANRECMTYAAAARNSRPPNPHDEAIMKSHGALLEQFTGHLTKEDLDYFSKWDRLIDLEADACQTLISEAWLTESEIRERETGKCVSSLVFDQRCSTCKDTSDDSLYSILSFRRSENSTLHTPLSDLGFEPGCHVVISEDSKIAKKVPPGGPLPRMYIVRGFLHQLSTTHFTVRASKEDLSRVQRFASQAPLGNPMRFRIDRDDGATGTGTVRQNLINLFASGTGGPEAPTVWPTRLPALRQCVVGLCAPRYEPKLLKTLFSPKTQSSGPLPELPGCTPLDLFLEYSELNSDQQAAADKVMTSIDYSLIQGLPGTGKSSIITFVARLLAAHGKRVLISAYTHAAVDNVMLKLMEKGLSYTGEDRPSPILVRVGAKSSCHPKVHPILDSNCAMALEPKVEQEEHVKAMPSAESLREAIRSARIVGATALSIPRSPLLLGEHFDVVIVDEAGQISQPAVLGALMAADSFVLVGDHMQLPPLVTSELAAQGGFGVSLLKRIADGHPESLAQLTMQYRMHEEICQLSNDIAYGGKLKCATDEIKRRLLELPGFPENVPALGPTSLLWLKTTIDPTKPVIFLDTDKIKVPNGSKNGEPSMTLERSSSRRNGGSIVNDTEAILVRHVVNSLVACGLQASSIGVVCPFRAQLRILEECSSLKQMKEDGLEMSTIDRYQGRDKPAIILSFVRSNPKHKVGRLLEDFRRLNVAITRAKYKLIMIGSFSTLYNGSQALQPVLERVRNQERVVQVPTLPA